ncbi:uncharacterized [Tachysurus ichikawai]
MMWLGCSVVQRSRSHLVIDESCSLCLDSDLLPCESYSAALNAVMKCSSFANPCTRVVFSSELIGKLDDSTRVKSTG